MLLIWFARSICMVICCATILAFKASISGSSIHHSSVGHRATRPLFSRIDQYDCYNDDNKRVVITGGTLGIGWCLAREFLLRGDSVLICSRTSARVEAALQALRPYVAADAVLNGIVADVAEPTDVENLAVQVQKSLGGVDHWVNAAGSVTQNAPLINVQPNDIITCTRANLIGPLLCSRIAMQIMLEQQTGKKFTDGSNLSVTNTYSTLTDKSLHIWNFGFGNFGRSLSRSAATHKSTKAGLSALTEVLKAEVKPYPAIAVHQCSPGVVLTDLLLNSLPTGENSIAAKNVFNALAIDPDSAARQLCEKMRSADGSDAAVELLTPVDALTKLVSEVPNIILKRGGQHFDAEGNRVKRSGVEYKANGAMKLY
mmetsp:Transcript_29518/g.49416  ORF Transcript_29518/g.49416 Transcript_29518/m.49416 type:complete len:371 (+) Transcript_29518:45-1157(+)